MNVEKLKCYRILYLICKYISKASGTVAVFDEVAQSAILALPR
jgi:hypothetical protein